MVAINFTKFVDKVEAREKRMTIRKTARGKVGDKVQLYTGMRTSNCRKLIKDDPVLTDIFPIEINSNGTFYNHPIEYLYQKDGFRDLADFLNFFNKTYGLPFSGFVHIWEWEGA